MHQKSNFWQQFSLRQFFPFWSAAVVILILVWSFFVYRWILVDHFDYTYFKDWYDHSQWQIPLSPRIMGDAELYQLSGYSLVKGGDPFQINPEVPPLVKYFYGLSIVWTGNPYYSSAVFYFLSVIGFGWLCWFAFPESRWTRFIAVVLFLLNPLFFSQIGQVGLDLPQLVFLLFHCIFLFLALRHQRAKLPFYLISGLFLGAFTAAKIGFFLPMIIVADTWLLWRSKQLKWITVLVGMTGVTYVTSYLPYFLQGHTLLAWLKAQKWMIEFYRSSRIDYLPGMIFPSLLVGYFIHWTNGLTVIPEWTITWPLSLGVVTTVTIQHLQSLKKSMAQSIKKNLTKKLTFSELLWPYLFYLTAGLILLNTAIPFWPRYLMLVVPFLLLFLTRFLVKHRKILILILFLLFGQFLWYSFPQPQEMVSLSTSAWQSASYAEVYNFITQPSQEQITRANFISTFQLVQTRLEDPSISLTTQTPLTWPWQTTAEVPLTVTYHTVLGDLKISSQLHLVRENNQWRIAWQWSSVLPNFDSYSQVILIKNIPPAGRLLTKDDAFLSVPDLWPFISVVPNKVQNADHLNNLLTLLTNAQGPDIRIRLFVTHAGDTAVPIGFVKPFYDPAAFQELSKDPSVIIDQRLTRVYNADVAQSPSLEFVQNQEKLHPELVGQVGGQVLIQKPSGKKIVIFSRTMIPGQNVFLAQTFGELFHRDYVKTP